MINSPSFKTSSLTSPVHTKKPSSLTSLVGNLSGSTLNNSVNNNSNSNSAALKTKIFSMRPHPPLIPHFQLPTDTQPNNKDNPVEINQTLKRFMYKKAKLSEPFGKCK